MRQRYYGASYAFFGIVKHGCVTVEDAGKCRAWLCQRIWRAVCYPLGALPCTCLARRTAECSNIPRACDRRALRTPQTYRRAAARGVHANLAADPAPGVLPRLQQGVSTTEVAQEQGVMAITSDEVVPDVPLALLERLAFFASGHQATLLSIQWKSAFVATSCSPPTVTRSRPTVLIALATSLLCIWNVAPLDITSSLHRGIQSAPLADPPPKSQAHVTMLAGAHAAFGISQYFAALLLVSLCARRGRAAAPSHGVEGVCAKVYAWCC
ncbi:hypothetical protein F5888DRAFT_258256 [Russula emetica]|nr:hypothetical protein F5888DRAFT_258256 [Russula emetica]